RLSAPAVEQRFTFFAGPKIDAVLGAYPKAQLEHLLDFSSWWPFAESLSMLLLAVLRWLSSLTTSWGWAIIILTFFVRMAVHPLSRSSIKNTQKMQKLAPKIREIQDRYKGKTSKEAQHKMTLEIWELQRAEGALPILGCLPMLCQL